MSDQEAAVKIAEIVCSYAVGGLSLFFLYRLMREIV